MAAHRGTGKSTGFEGQSSEKPVYIVNGPVATPVAGFANNITGEPPAPKMRMAPKPAMDGDSALPLGETLGRKNSSKSPNPFNWKNPGGKK